MSNTWKNSNNIVDIINKQAEMVELTRMGDKIVLLDIGDDDYVSNKTIKNNKLVWRSIWSYLDNDTTDLIYKSITMNNMKDKVLQIKRWPVRSGYVCNLQFNSLGHTARLSYKSNREMDSKLEKCIFLKIFSSKLIPLLIPVSSKYHFPLFITESDILYIDKMSVFVLTS